MRMSQSNNPGGSAKVLDSELVEALESAVDRENDQIAATAADVAENLEIKKQAVRKRLDNLVRTGDEVKRFKAGRAYVYYPAHMAEDPTTVVQTATPVAAPVEPARRGWREYLTRAISAVMREPVEETKAWYDHKFTNLSAVPLLFFIPAFILFAAVPWFSGLLVGVSLPFEVVTISGIMGGIIALLMVYALAAPDSGGKE